MAARKHYLVPTAPTRANFTARFGAQSAGYTYKEENKAVKLAAESQYNLCAAGDAIEAWVRGVEVGTSDGFTIAGLYQPNLGDMVFATCDGLQATPGTGTLAIGDYVVAGSATAAGTALTAYQKVCKATDQAAAKAGPFAYRVVSFPNGSTGAVGGTCTLQRVS